MAYYDNILNLISLVLALSILFIILFGCQFQKYRYIEKFTDATEPATHPPATEPATKTETATCGSVTSLKPFEVDLIKKINLKQKNLLFSKDDYWQI